MPALNIHTVAGGSDLEGPVVRNNFPEEVLKRLKIVNTKRNELVNEFWYDEKQCFYSQSRIEDLEGAHKYARIIGLDSNQSDLSSEILSASLMVAGVTSQLAFVADVWNQEVPAYQADKKKFRVGGLELGHGLVTGTRLWGREAFAKLRKAVAEMSREGTVTSVTSQTLPTIPSNPNLEYMAEIYQMYFNPTVHESF
eukprot:g15690.t1